MRLPKNDPVVLSLPEFFESRLPTEEVIEAAQLDRSLWPGVESRIAGFDVVASLGARAWGEASQAALKRIGVEVGLPSSQVQDVIKNVAHLGNVSAMNETQLRAQLVKTGIAIAVATTSWIPIIGRIVEGIATIAELFYGLATAGADAAAEVLPPFSQYTDETDEYVVNNQTLPVLATLDWTGLFLPRLDPSSDWSFDKRDVGGSPGFLFAPIRPGSGLGFIPGTQQITSVINIYVKRDERLDLKWKVGDAQDVGDFYPSAAQLVTGLWGQLQGRSWQLFTVDTHRVERQWNDYVGNAKSYIMSRWHHGDAQRKAEFRTAMRPLLVQQLHGEWQRAVLNTNFVGGSLGSYPSIADKLVRPAMEAMRARQWSALGTLACAYAARGSAAFRGADGEPMLARLDEMRTKLLDSPYAYDVKLEDVIDDDYRAELRAIGVGQLGLKGPDAAPAPKLLEAVSIVPDNPDPPEATPPQGPAMTTIPARASGGASPIVLGGAAVLALGGLALVARRRRRV